jgi:hypothetical protein
MAVNLRPRILVGEEIKMIMLAEHLLPKVEK